MKCPHCRVEFHDNNLSKYSLGIDADGGWILFLRLCPKCRHFIIHLHNGHPPVVSGRDVVGLNNEIVRLAWPRASARPPCPTEVPPAIREDYNEACLVLADSPKASAALSRRCLQTVLRETAKVKPADLYNEIQEVLDSKALPTHIADGLDAVRAIGNLGTHPIKSQHTGEVVPVEPGEAEWNLDVLESVFDFYYVQPALLKAKRDKLNAKLNEAGKPPIR